MPHVSQPRIGITLHLDLGARILEYIESRFDFSIILMGIFLTHQPSDPAAYAIRQDIFSIDDNGASIDSIHYTFTPSQNTRRPSQPSQFELVLLPPERSEESRGLRPITVSVFIHPSYCFPAVPSVFLPPFTDEPRHDSCHSQFLSLGYPLQSQMNPIPLSLFNLRLVFRLVAIVPLPLFMPSTPQTITTFHPRWLTPLNPIVAFFRWVNARQTFKSRIVHVTRGNNGHQIYQPLSAT